MSSLSPEFVELQRRLAGRYSLEEELHRSPRTIRFRARDVALERAVVLEFLRGGGASDGSMVDSFLAGARRAAGLFHPHIQLVHAVEEVDGLACVVRAPVRGESLDQRVSSGGALPAESVRRMLEEVAWALTHAHDRGVTHGCLSPEHIFLEEETGRAVVTGLGTARVLERPDPAFAPPESEGRPEPGRSVAGDLYALGACGEFALTGKVHGGSGPGAESRQASRDGVSEGGERSSRDTRAELVRMGVRVTPGDDAEEDRALVTRLQGVIDRCLSPDPESRPGSAAEVTSLVAASGELPATLPPSARRLLRRIRQFSPTAGIGLFVLYLARDSNLDLAIAAAVGGSFAWMGTGLLRTARQVLDDGLDLKVITGILEEEARELRKHPDASSHWLQNLAIGCGTLAFWVSVVPFGIFLLVVGVRAVVGGGPGLALGEVGVASLLLVTFLFLAGPTETKGSPRRWLNFGERMMVGRFGRLLFRVARLGRKKGQAPRLAAPGEPTAVALSRAVEDLLDQLPPELRREFADAPEVIHGLRDRIRALRSEEEALARSLRELERGVPDGGHVGGGGDPAGFPEGGAGPTGVPAHAGDDPEMAEESRRQVEMRIRLEEARTRVRERTFELTRTLEHVRLKLLRMAARAGEEAELAGELTVELERADRLGTEAAELLRARDEVRRLLDPSPGGPSPDRSPARSGRSSFRSPPSSGPSRSGAADGGSETDPTSRSSSPPGRAEPHDAAD